MNKDKIKKVYDKVYPHSRQHLYIFTTIFRILKFIQDNFKTETRQHSYTPETNFSLSGTIYCLNFKRYTHSKIPDPFALHSRCVGNSGTYHPGFSNGEQEGNYACFEISDAGCVVWMGGLLRCGVIRSVTYFVLLSCSTFIRSKRSSFFTASKFNGSTNQTNCN